MQEQMAQAQSNRANTLVEGCSGNGLVTVTLNGAKDLKTIKIKPEVLSDPDALEDLIIGAFQNAVSKIDTDSGLSHFEGLSNLLG